MSNAALDASAIIAVLDDEPGAARAIEFLDGAVISAVNYAEVISKYTRDGVPLDSISSRVQRIALDVVPFDTVLALEVGRLRPLTAANGLSIGDRACLAVAASLGVPAVTSDRRWRGLDVGVEIIFIR